MSVAATKKLKSGGKILVTGGAGFIGSHALLALLNAGYECVSFDNYDNSSLEAIERVRQLSGKQVIAVDVDLINLAELREAVQTHGPFSAVLHFAGFKAVGESTKIPLHYYYNNVVGSLNLFVVMQQYNISNLVFSSSCTVYGNQKKLGAFSEQDVSGCANSPYGWTKVQIEQILRDAAQANGELKCIFLRYFNPVGAHESGRLGEDPLGVPNNLFPFVAQVASGKREKIMVFGSDYDTPDGTGVRDYIHVMDLADAHVLALEHQLAKQSEQVEVYNIGTGKGSSVLEVIACFEKVCGRRIPYEFAPRRQGDVDSAYCDPEKAEKHLGFKATRTLEDACRDGWKWQTDNPNGFDASSPGGVGNERRASVFELFK